MRDPRRFLLCPTCHDFGMLEDSSGNEDVCPTCEGGIWRERESWRWYIHRQSWFFGLLRISMTTRIPRIYRNFPA